MGVELARRLDDDQRVSVRVAQPEHRRHRVAVAADLVVDVDAGGLECGVVGVDIRRVEADPGLAAAGLLPLRRRGERDRRRGSRKGDLDPAHRLAPPRPTELLATVRHLPLLQIDPTAAIAPSADLVLWSRLGSSYDPARLKQALEQDRTLFELDALVRPMSDLGLHLSLPPP